MATCGGCDPRGGCITFCLSSTNVLAFGIHGQDDDALASRPCIWGVGVAGGTQPTKFYVHHLLSSQSSWSMSLSRNLPLSRHANNTYQNTIRVSLHSLLLPPVQHYLTIPNRFSAIVQSCNKQTHNHIDVQRKGRVICLGLLRPPTISGLNPSHTHLWQILISSNHAA